MKKRRYTVIVFDLGNVLIPFDYQTALEKLEKIEKSLGEKFWNFYKSNYNLHRSFEKGGITEKDFIEKMLASLENKIDEKRFCSIYSEIFSENKEVTSLLPELKKNYQLVLLSNTNSIHMEYGWKNYTFLKYFDKLILSHEVKAVKPEPEIYKAVEAFTKKPPEKHLFVDDILEYAEAAKKIGWDSVQFINAKQLKVELKLKGIL